MKKIIVLILYSFVHFLSIGQTKSTISDINIVRCKGDFEREAIYFYEQNWKVFRDEAFKKQYISSYQLMRTPIDSTGRFEMILITGYPDSISYRKSEEHFQLIMKSIRPNGPKMLNAVKRSDFVESVKSYTGKTL